MQVNTLHHLELHIQADDYTWYMYNIELLSELFLLLFSLFLPTAPFIYFTLACTCMYMGNYNNTSSIREIPNQFSKHLPVTPLELNQIWYVCSTCGFMKPDKILLTVVVWFPGYGPLNIQVFTIHWLVFKSR